MTRSPLPTRTARHAGTVLAFALLVGVVAACVLIVKTSGLDLHMWGVVHGDSVKVYAPGGIYGLYWDTAQYEPFSRSQIGWHEILLAVVAYGGTFVIGERILRVLVARLRWPAPLRLGAGFLVGYVPVFTVVRIVTLRFTKDVAPVICLALVATAAIVSLASDAISRRNRPRAARRRADVALGVAVLGTFSAMVVWTVQSGRNYLVSDSVQLFLSVTRGDLGSLHWLPPFGRQIDELLFNYPMAFAFKGSTTYALWFWLTDAFAKASMVCLILGFAWTLTKGRWLVATMSAALVLFATPIADPTVYVSLFGGQNPAIYLGHAGRFLGIVLPFLLILVFSEGTSRKGWVICGGLALGLMGTTASNIVFAAVVLGILSVVAAGRLAVKIRSDRARQKVRVVTDIAVAVAFASPIVTYATLNLDDRAGFGGVFLFVGVLAGTLAIVAIAVGRDWRDDTEPSDSLSDAIASVKPWRLVPLAVGALAGVLVMGNLFYKPLMENDLYRSVMRGLFPPYREPVLLVNSFVLRPFHHASCAGVPTPACSSFRGFFGYFGLTLGVAGLAWLLIRCSSASPGLRRRDMMLLLAEVVLLNLGFFLTDFMGPEAPYWIQTRFIEVGYYGILILFPVIAWNHLRGYPRLVMLAAASAWIAVPFVSHPFLEQWWTNLRYLTHVLG